MIKWISTIFDKIKNTKNKDDNSKSISTNNINRLLLENENLRFRVSQLTQQNIQLRKRIRELKDLVK